MSFSRVTDEDRNSFSELLAPRPAGAEGQMGILRVGSFDIPGAYAGPLRMERLD